MEINSEETSASSSSLPSSRRSWWLAGTQEDDAVPFGIRWLSGFFGGGFCCDAALFFAQLRLLVRRLRALVTDEIEVETGGEAPTRPFVPGKVERNRDGGARVKAPDGAEVGW